MGNLKTTDNLQEQMASTLCTIKIPGLTVFL